MSSPPHETSFDLDQYIKVAPWFLIASTTATSYIDRFLVYFNLLTNHRVYLDKQKDGTIITYLHVRYFGYHVAITFKGVVVANEMTNMVKGKPYKSQIIETDNKTYSIAYNKHGAAIYCNKSTMDPRVLEGLLKHPLLIGKKIYRINHKRAMSHELVSRPIVIEW